MTIGEIGRLKLRLARLEEESRVLAALLLNATTWIDTTKVQPNDGEFVATLTLATISGETRYVHNIQFYIGGEWSDMWQGKDKPQYWFRLPQTPERTDHAHQPR